MGQITLADVAADLRALAGALYPRTSDNAFAQAVEALEECARKIEELDNEHRGG